MSGKSDEAAGVLRIATKRMVSAYPLYAHLLSMARVREDRDVDTMGVTIRDAQLTLLYNVDFVLGLTIEQTVGVLHHEVLHVIFGHLLAKPEDYPDRWARTVAQEVTVNEWVPEPLPGTPILLKDYPKLPPLEDTDRRYERLESACSKQYVGAPTDNHEIWVQARSAGRVGEAVIASAVRRAVDSLSPAEREQVPAEIMDACSQRVAGTELGAAREELDKGRDASVPWQRELRRFVGRTAHRVPSYLRPPRRFPQLVGVVPGNVRRPDKPRVMAVIDTSGSMTRELLEQVGAELRRMGTSHRVIVVECDTAIQRTYEFTGKLEDVQGRGGTDLRPPFATQVLAKFRPDVVVYFTDGWGEAPADPPRVPVLWCLTIDGIVPAPWGRTTWMR